MDSKDFRTLNDVYKLIYSEAKDESPEKEEEDRKKDDDLFGSPNKKKNGKKADKDYDGDGKVESSKDEYFGSKDKAIKKAMNKEEYTVTNADKKGNTPAYQAYKAGKKNVKTGKPMYKAADHMKEEQLQEKQKDTPDQVAAVIDMYRSKKGTGEAVKDTEEGKKKAAKKERDYAAFEREKMKKDDPNWKHKKGSTTESVDADYIEIVREIKSAETQADIKRWGALKESGNFTDEELDTIVEADIADILARLEKKRISKGGDPEESPLPAMRKYHANKKKVKEEVEIELDEAERSLSDRLARKRKLYDKTTKKALEYARREGEAAGHARYRMGSIDREMDGIKAKMNKEN